MSNIPGDLLTAYRLMRRTEALIAERNDKRALTGLNHPKTAKDWLEEDEALLSGQTPEAAKSQAAVHQRPPAEDQRIRLSDLVQRLKDIQTQGPQTASRHEETTIEYSSVETEISLEYRQLTPVEGLVRRGQNKAETDRYEFDFIDGGTFKITDKWSNKSTTIWGDPHVDVSDVEGNREGEFSDLQDSNSQTTLQLQDGTRVTFTARDNGIIEAVDIFKGSQHLRGIGVASREWQNDTMLFSAAVENNGLLAMSQVPLGDVVRAGGDGNDWFDLSGRLIWGKTTGPIITSRPAYTLQLSVTQTTTQASFQQVIDRQA